MQKWTVMQKWTMTAATLAATAVFGASVAQACPHDAAGYPMGSCAHRHHGQHHHSMPHHAMHRHHHHHHAGMARHHGAATVHGVTVVYGTTEMMPTLVMPPPVPRYYVNQGPVLSGPGLDHVPVVVYRPVTTYTYQDSAVSSWHPPLRHGYYYGYDGGPYADAMHHQYHGMTVAPPSAYRYAPRRAHFVPPQRRKIKAKIIHAAVE